MEGETHSRVVNGERQIFMTQRLWALAEELPVTNVPIADIAEFDQDCWFRGVAPTCRQVAEHAQRIHAADLAHPVILSATGGLMDGGHRIAKAWIGGASTVEAVRFAVDPEPDYTASDPEQAELSDKEVIAAGANSSRDQGGDLPAGER